MPGWFARTMSATRTGAPEVPGYRVGAPVGFGATGAVWAARDPDGRAVALSVLRLAPDERGAAQLRRLAALRGSHHPHLPRVLDVISLGGDRCALACELVEGPTLATVRTARGPLTPAEAATLLDALGSALGHLHDRGVVHGDVSPANVILTGGGRPVLTDLAGEVTREAGTPGFVAPERAGGAPASAPGDLWSLARTLLWAVADDPVVGDVLSPALRPAPEERPAARDLAACAPVLADRVPVALPADADLAAAQLRSRAGQPPTALAAPGRWRTRTRRLRRRRPRSPIPLLVALGLGVGVLGGAAAARSAAPATGGPDAVLEQLVAARDEALTAGDAGGLATLTVPGSAPAAADAAVVRALGGTRPRGLSTTVVDVRVVEHGPSRLVLEAVTRQSGYTLTGPAEHRAVGPQPERCTRYTLAGPAPWRVGATAPCSLAGGDRAAG